MFVELKDGSVFNTADISRVTPFFAGEAAASVNDNISSMPEERDADGKVILPRSSLPECTSFARDQKSYPKNQENPATPHERTALDVAKALEKPEGVSLEIRKAFMDAHAGYHARVIFTTPKPSVLIRETPQEFRQTVRRHELENGPAN